MPALSDKIRNQKSPAKAGSRLRREKIKNQNHKPKFKIIFKFLHFALSFCILIFAFYIYPLYAYEHPKYEIDASIDTARHFIQARQKVTFVNNSHKSTSQIYFHIYPHRKYSKEEKNFILRYAAYFKVNPFPEGFQSGDLKINTVSAQGRNLQYSIEGKDNTILRIDLDREIAPGDLLVLDLDYLVVIPHMYGRFGWHKNITSLLRWYPMLSVLDKEGWHNYPFYPYHQPYFSEAALYSVKLTVAKEETAIHSGILKEETQNPDCSKTLFIESEL